MIGRFGHRGIPSKYRMSDTTETLAYFSFRRLNRPPGKSRRQVELAAFRLPQLRKRQSPVTGALLAYAAVWRYPGKVGKTGRKGAILFSVAHLVAHCR